jgi:hypothetical protein
MESKEMEIYSDRHGYIEYHQCEMYSCTKKETYLIPPKAELSGRKIEVDRIVNYIYNENVPMVKECEEFKPHWK